MRISDWSSDVCSSDLFDEQVIAQLETGQLAPLVAMSSPELRENAGNGGLEIVNWIAVATIAGRHGLRGEKIYYEPMTRSEERRVGKEWVSTCRSRGEPDA